VIVWILILALFGLGGVAAQQGYLSDAGIWIGMATLAWVIRDAADKLATAISDKGVDELEFNPPTDA
jgi:hypothetical protein